MTYSTVTARIVPIVVVTHAHTCIFIHHTLLIDIDILNFAIEIPGRNIYCFGNRKAN